MSKGDYNKFSIPTIYKGIKMRSKLETKVAFFLDTLEIKWIYEPQSFMLSCGVIYVPDFYLPELKIWIEVKGFIEEHNKDYSKAFVKDNQQDLILISDKEFIFFGYGWFVGGGGIKTGEVFLDNDVYLGKCSNCGSYFFVPNTGDYSCLKCGRHEGDHDLLETFNGFGREDIDFSDLDSIKEGLKKYGASV